MYSHFFSEFSFKYVGRVTSLNSTYEKYFFIIFLIDLLFIPVVLRDFQNFQITHFC